MEGVVLDLQESNNLVATGISLGDTADYLMDRIRTLLRVIQQLLLLFAYNELPTRYLL